MKTVGTFLSLLLALTALQGCGGKNGGGDSSPGSNQVRLVNASPAFASLDMTASGTTLATGVATGSASSYAGLASGISTFTLGLGGSGAPSAQATLALSSTGLSFTLVAFTAGRQLQIAELTDNEVAPAAGDGKIRLLNLAALDSGNVDVYVAAGGGTLANASALVTNLPGTTGYFEITAGTYHVWVTGVGNKADLRLDIPSIVVSDQQVLSLILTSTTGGVLVDGWLIAQQGAVSARENTSARIRVAANIAAGGSISATANGVSLGASTLISPVVGAYALVPAGALTMSVVVNGSAVSVANLTAPAGADLTLLANGGGAAPAFFLLNDDNRLPLGGISKIRLVNGINGLTDNLSLVADFSVLAQDVAPGTASTPANARSGTITSLDVNSSQSNTFAFHVATSVALQSQGVYSVFMLGSNTAPVAILRSER